MNGVKMCDRCAGRKRDKDGNQWTLEEVSRGYKVFGNPEKWNARADEILKNEDARAIELLIAGGYTVTKYWKDVKP